jgi:uncharacterized membrane protein
MQFWSDNNLTKEEKLLMDWNIDYIFFGREEKNLGFPNVLDHLKVIYEDPIVLIYEVSKDE